MAWWVARRDSSVVLVLSRSADNGTHWEPPRTADSSDRGVRGCARPAPAVAIDPTGGYTHLAYFVEPPTGSGIFYEHLMEMAVHRAPDTLSSPDSPRSRGDTSVAAFHAPVAIVYGDIPADVGVAAHGDTVVTAYVDPNRAVPQVSLAASVTAGHTFAPALRVSGEGVAARRPVIAAQGSAVAVGWEESPIRTDAEINPEGPAPSHAIVRVGTFQ